ncbi:hypothetical protein HF086_006563 [Spodoptera exigua]|uniref:Uncharacterized protein n=1 Tax=Spodoptera exigua TaxID=7107 RepID=A0A922MPK0_SPOEX|nr:hypothetical protein HF086_006563 [Spodoptera exigua]
MYLLLFAEEADAEIRTSGRSIEEMPSKIGREITDSLGSLTNIVERGMASNLTYTVTTTVVLVKMVVVV